MNLTRRDIIKRAYTECLSEMYAKAQPSADYNQLIQDVKDKKIKDSAHEPVYQRYYLSYEEFHYILDKYINAYGMNEQWSTNMDTIYDYFNGNGIKDVWIPEEIDDNGYRHGGYRSSEHLPHIKKQFINLIQKETNKLTKKKIEKISEKLSDIVLENIYNCKNFYCFDREESDFSASIALGCSPTSSKEQVIKYWKQQGIDITIEDRNPLLFWEKDEYGDEFEEYMLDEYGEDWEEYWWKKYYNSKDGKQKLVTNFILENKDKNSEFDKLFVRTEDDEELYVIKFEDENYEIPIDEFIEKYNIQIPKH